MMEDEIMKKSLFIGLVAILGLIGCSRNQEIDVPDANLSLFARTESQAESRTVVESGIHVYWEPGDEIAVFMGEKVARFTTDITAASGTATFNGTFGDQGWPEELDLWAVYPFSEDATFDGETITTVLPSEQVAREGSFGKNINLAIAHSNSSTLQFYNVGGGIRFSVTQEGIKKVMFEGLSGEIISGKVKIGMDENGKPVVQEVTGGSQFITLLPPSGQETFEPGVWYYILAIPGALEKGYKLRFYKDTDYARKVSEKKVEIIRSVFGNVDKADEGIEYDVFLPILASPDVLIASGRGWIDSFETSGPDPSEYRVEPMVSWLSVMEQKSVSGRGHFTIHVQENDEASLREGCILVYFNDFPVPDTLTVRQYERLPAFSYTTEMRTVMVPNVEGEDQTGFVFWGDDSNELYQPGISHTYSSSGEHTVSIEVRSKKRISFGGLNSGMSINFRELRNQ